ncbi:MAG: MmgE/PrpD family protein [Thermincola sp.]|nr:MmgE/PrpD family protein [Thermincola sp.]MDT3704178.1 MmgE/PrpD family protein [Thermincola sp.]
MKDWEYDVGYLFRLAGKGRFNVVKTDELVRFIVHTNFSDFEPELIDLAKGHLLDTLGVCSAGTGMEAAQMFQRFVEANGGSGECNIIGTTITTSAPLAAMANGISGHVLDYDDSIATPTPLHPSVVIMPAIFAIGQQIRATGRDILTSYIVGVEAGVKVAKSMTLAGFRKGWHATGTVGTLAAAAGAANLLRLDEAQTEHALSIAMSTASGSRQQFGTMVKPVQVGNAAHNGVRAGLLAKTGCTASKSPLEGTRGFYQIFGDMVATDTDNSEQVLLGNPYSLISPGIAIKQYPSCYATHSSVEAILDLVRVDKFSPQDVRMIECLVDPHTIATLRYHTPSTPLEAKFSMNFCVAVASMYGALGLEHFNQDILANHELRDLMAKIKMRPAETAENERYLGSTVILELTSGQRKQRHVESPRGYRASDLSKEELIKKFADCLLYAGKGGSLRAQNVEGIIDMVYSLEKVGEINELISKLIP